MAGSSQVALLLLILISSVAIAQDAPLPSPPMPGRFSVTITSGDYKRVAHVHIPKGYSKEAPPVLVLALHDAGSGVESLVRLLKPKGLAVHPARPLRAG